MYFCSLNKIMKRMVSTYSLCLPIICMLISIQACKNNNDEVIAIPQTITEIVYNSRNTSVFEAAVNKANLGSILQGNNVTVFIPTDAAFANSGIAENTISTMPVAAVEALVKYHIINTQAYTTNNYPVTTTMVSSLAAINGVLHLKKDTSGLYVNGNRITQASILAQNGVAHVLDYVLGAPLKPVGAPSKKIGNVIAEDSTLTLLNMAIQKTAGTANDVRVLIEGLNDNTIFAPTNLAFTIAGFDSTAIANASASRVDTLANIIKYHITAGKLFIPDISNNQTINTLYTMAAGQLMITGVNPIVLKGASNNITNSAKVELGNLLATNGLIHKIDKLLLP
jgi:uncharacterized surface protein with fasciclin (FAS1) repeats